MKKSLLTIFAALAFVLGNAQMAPNSYCPDFTGTDLDGNEWNLYDLLDSGKPVIIEVSAAWCAPCWAYHQTHALKNFYTQYGPDGTDEAMVIFIEGESTNTEAQLHAAANTNQYATHSQGDWVTGTPFPIIDDAAIANTLQIGYFPTIYLVCPDRVINEVGQLTTAEAYAAVSNVNCSAATQAVDPRFLSVTGVNANCTEPTAGVNITLQNKGTEPLTSATISITGANSPVTYDWTGNLATYEIANITIPGITTNGQTTVTVAVTSADDNTQNSTTQLAVNSSIAESSTHIRVEFRNDPWPEENSWKIRNSSGTIVASSPTFPAQPSGSTLQTFNYWVPSTGCYTFEFADEYSDGLNGTYWGSGANYYNGSLNVYSVDANGTTTLLYSNDGTEVMNDATLGSAPASEYAPFNANTVVSTEEINTTSTSFNVYPNPTSGIINLNYSLSYDAEVFVDVINSVGVRVKSERLGSQKHGTYNTPIDLSSLAAGIYMLNLNADGIINTVRVIVK